MANQKRKTTKKQDVKTIKKTQPIKEEKVKEEVKIEKETKEIQEKEIKPTKKQKKRQKRIILCVIVGIVLLMVLGTIFNKEPYVYKGLHLANLEQDINFDVFYDKVTNAKKDELYFLTLFTDTKTDATLYKDMVENIYKKYSFDNYYIYYTNMMTSEEIAQMNDLLGGGVSAYPMTFVFKNKEVLGAVWGYQLEESYLMELNNFIKTDDYLRNKENDFFNED